MGPQDDGPHDWSPLLDDFKGCFSCGMEYEGLGYRMCCDACRRQATVESIRLKHERNQGNGEAED